MAIASGGVLWLGADGRIPVSVSKGVVLKTASAWVLFVPAAIFSILAALALSYSRALHAAVTNGADRGADFVNAIASQSGALRALIIGAAAIMIGAQTIALVRAGGVVEPFGIDSEEFVRIAFGAFGLLICAFGNVAPKAPYFENESFNAAKHFRFVRFSGVVTLLGGIALCIIAIAAPFNTLSALSASVTFAMMALLIVRGTMLLRRRKSNPG